MQCEAGGKGSTKACKQALRVRKRLHLVLLAQAAESKVQRVAAMRDTDEPAAFSASRHNRRVLTMRTLQGMCIRSAQAGSKAVALSQHSQPVQEQVLISARNSLGYRRVADDREDAQVRASVLAAHDELGATAGS